MWLRPPPHRNINAAGANPAPAASALSSAAPQRPMIGGRLRDAAQPWRAQRPHGAQARPGFMDPRIHKADGGVVVPEFGAEARRKLMLLNQQIDEGMSAAGLDPQPTPQAEEDIFAGANSFFADPGYAPSALSAAAPQRDMPDLPAFGDDVRMRQMFLNRRIDDDIRRMEKASEVPRMESAVMGDPRLGMPLGAYPEARRDAIPIPRARPMPTTYTVRKGDNPTKIAEALGMSLAELEAKNPGLLKRARRLKIGSQLKV